MIEKRTNKWKPTAGFFDGADTNHEVAFRYGVERVNGNRNVLPRAKLLASSDRLPASDSFTASKKICQLMRNGLAAVFGPSSDDTSDHVRSVCQTVRLPHVQSRWVAHGGAPLDDAADAAGVDGMALNLYPDAAALSRAYWDVVRLYNWKSFTILYQHEAALIRLQHLLAVTSNAKYHGPYPPWINPKHPSKTRSSQGFMI